MLKPTQRAMNAYKTFHGKQPTRLKQGVFHVPKHLILLGDAVEIVYRTDKLNGGGDGKPCEYIHKFSPNTKLYMDERKGKMIYIKGSKLTVTNRGITN